VIGRIGGEEFALLLPETTAEAAQHLASRITEACRSIIVDESVENARCSCSLGVTEVRPDDERLDTVLTRADQALYAAKRAGRNRWSFAA
jgi:diguanylate cyclase (GGDEF)-like protein